jgi:hypothetical protein
MFKTPTALSGASHKSDRNIFVHIQNWRVAMENGSFEHELLPGG